MSVVPLCDAPPAGGYDIPKQSMINSPINSHPQLDNQQSIARPADGAEQLHYHIQNGWLVACRGREVRRAAWLPPEDVHALGAVLVKSFSDQSFVLLYLNPAMVPQLRTIRKMDEDDGFIVPDVRLKETYVASASAEEFDFSDMF